MIIENKEIQVGQIVIVRESTKYSFYLVVGYKKSEVAEQIEKAKELVTTDEAVYKLVVNSIDKDLYFVRLLGLKINSINGNKIEIENEQQVLNQLIKEIHFVIKQDILKYNKYFKKFDNYNNLKVIQYNVKSSTLRKWTKDNYISKENIKDIITITYRDTFNKVLVNRPEIRGIYCYVGIKTARFYLYLGKEKLYMLGSCANEVSKIQKLYDSIKNNLGTYQGILLDTKIGNVGTIRKTEEKGSKIKLYDTGLKYKVVMIDEEKRYKLKKFGFSERDIDRLVGA